MMKAEIAVMLLENQEGPQAKEYRQLLKGENHGNIRAFKGTGSVSELTLVQ